MNISDYKPEQEELEQLTPQKRRKAKPQKNTTKGDKTPQKCKGRPEIGNNTLSIRLECSEKFRELRFIHGKDEGSIRVLQQLDIVQNQHRWHIFVICFSRLDASCPIEHADPYRIALCGHPRRWKRSKPNQHNEKFIARSSTELTRSMDTRLVDFTRFPGNPSTKRSKRGNIAIKKWSNGEDVQKWIEIFQVDTVIFQDDEEPLDFCI
ncbi:hypothetical protein LTS14_007242 [Recurvomyces mirabilis]|uniref:uncharacterized protein n=1 Tax=Recurvomyces mirabilis TaxID=574656 RepID=UPI002DE19334|nr:hypothetical protein LTS14_007242 [Recurvomyces mirabilis]